MPRGKQTAKPTIPEMASRSDLTNRLRKDRPFAMAAGMGHDTFDFDASFDPLDHPNRYNMNPRRNINIGGLVPQENMLPRDEIYSTALTPSGNYLTDIVPRNTFRNGWKYVSSIMKTEPLDPDLHEYLMHLDLKYNCIMEYMLGTQICEIFGKCAAILRQMAPMGYKRVFQLDMIPIFDEDIDYDKSGKIIAINPQLRIGREYQKFTFNSKRFVMWRSEKDIFGNEYQGKLALIPAYNTIARTEEITDSNATIMSQRGLGLLFGQVEGADEATLRKYAEKYGNPSQYSVLFTDERFKLTCFDAISKGYSITDLLKAMGGEFSKATGLPHQRAEGSNEGKLSGAEVSQDNQAESYATLQRRYQTYMIKTHVMLDSIDEKRGIDDLSWTIDWDIEMKMDRQKRSNIFTTEATAINQVDSLLTVNQCLERLGYAPWPEPEGSMLYVEWKMQYQQKKLEIQKTMTPGDGEINKNGEQIKAQQNPSAYQQRELNKETMAKRLVNAKDSYNRFRFSLDGVNEILTSSFGKGMSKGYLEKLREKPKAE